jgi:uncharacterized protein YecE (DUF72 family)
MDTAGRLKHRRWSSNIRFHGPDALERKYVGQYGARGLSRAAGRLRRPWLDGGWDVYAYFNNDYEGHAVDDARWLRARLASPASETPRSGP